MRTLRLAVATTVLLAAGLAGPGPAPAQDRARSKEVVVGFGAEPRTMLAVTIVDWTTNTQLEHIYDRLLDRDARTLKPKWGTHLDKIKNRNTGDMFFLGWGPALYGQGTVEPLFKADQTYASYGNNPVIDQKIARAVTVVDAKGRAAAYAELQKLVHDEAPWVFLWQQHDLYGVANHVEWSPRADEKVWMYDAKIVAR